MQQTWIHPTDSDRAAQPTSRFHATLPADLLRASVRRLRFLAVTVGIVSTLNFVIFTFVLRHSPLSRIDLFCMPTLVAISVALFFFARSTTIPATSVLNVGLAYEVVAALLIGLLVNEGPWPADRMMPSWSPVAVWVVVFPLLVPQRWQKSLPIAFASACMDPLSLGLTIWAGIPSPSLEIGLARFTPNLVAVVIGALASQVIYRLGAQVGEARQAGSYRLVERLGRGGMGEVWRARHKLLARPAAVKLIRPAALGSPSSQLMEAARARFAKEAQATASLRSPHTVVLYDYGATSDGDFYYVMELLDGLDLERLVQCFGPVSPDRAVHFLRQACHSLAEAHGKKMIHRDIKPANIFACRMGEDCDFTKVLDFGLVKHSPELQDESDLATGDGLITGTPAFMAPELALGKAEVQPAADVYMLGCVAYWLLSGQLVFDAPSPLAVITKHVNEAPAPLSTRSELPIPTALEDLIMECLSKDPRQRPQTAGVLSERLETLSLDRPWTQADARDWWQVHHPQAAQSVSDVESPEKKRNAT